MQRGGQSQWGRALGGRWRHESAKPCSKLRKVSLMSVEDSIEGEAIGPASGEVEDIDVVVWPGGLAHPAQQDLLTVCLLQV